MVVSGVRSSCERLSMNSARICCRRRSSDTSSSTSQTPPDADRRARMMSLGAFDWPSLTSPVDAPVSRPARAIASAWVSRNASVTVRETNAPNGTSSRSVRRVVRVHDPQPGIDTEDALGEDVEERVAVTTILRALELESVDTRPLASDDRWQVQR